MHKTAVSLTYNTVVIIQVPYKLKYSNTQTFSLSLSEV